MKNAVLLFIYKKPEQVNILIDQILKGTTADIYIHINKKYDRIRSSLVQDERIFVTNNNLPANWGDDGLCKAIFLMMKEVVNSGNDYNHVIICSGQDLIVRKGLDDFLENHSKDIYLDLRIANGRWDRMIHMKKIPRIFMNSFDSKLHPLRIGRSLFFRLMCSKMGGVYSIRNYDMMSLN